jgi:hypothetical protein
VPVNDPTPIERLEELVEAAPTQSEMQDRELLDRIDFVLEDAEGAPVTREPNITINEMPAMPIAAPAANPVPPPSPPRPSANPEVTPITSTRMQTGAKPRLQVIRGERLSIEYPVYPGKNFIGRTDDKPVDIDLEDQERSDRIWSSRQHAILHYENGVLMLEDLNSLNGTFVNRVRLIPGQLRTLQANDVIQVGTVQLRVILGEG